MAISVVAHSVNLYSVHRAVIFAIAVCFLTGLEKTLVFKEFLGF